MTEDRPQLPPSRRYTESDASRILGVSRKTLKRWRDAGKIRYITALDSGRIYYLGRWLVEAWLKG